MKKLFMVVNPKLKFKESAKIVTSFSDDIYFNNKPAAKKVRDAINEKHDGFIVSRGPDHWKEQ